jgi:RimJ/RimL family protein N-acetyltransferase
MSKLFEGNKVYLRPVSVEDGDLYYKTTLDNDIRRLTGSQRIFTKEFVHKYIENKANEASEILSFIVIKETDQIIGDIQLNDIDNFNRSANIRISIDKKENQGKGYGSEAMCLVLDYAFGIMNLHRIDLEVYSFNEPAIRTYEKIGFKKEGMKRDVLFYDHRYHHCIIMSILEHEYREKYL